MEVRNNSTPIEVLINRFLEWADGPAGIVRPKEIKIQPSPDPNCGLMCILDLSAIRENSENDEDLEPKAKRVASAIVSNLKVPHKALLNALFHEDDPLVQDMRAKLIKFNPKFFSLDDMPPDLMGPPKSKNELENDNVARLKVHPNVVLTLWYTLRQLRDENSFWRPYLDLLPKHIPTPLFWSEDELDIIKGTNLSEGVLQLRSLLRKVWNTLKAVDETPIALEEVYYCWNLFSSRAFTVSTDSSQDQVHTHTLNYNQTDSDAPALVEPCLVPFADIFNHSNDARVQYITDHRAHTFNLTLETVAQSGQEVFNNYGSKSNEFLIIGYGFAVLDLEDAPEPSISTATHSTEAFQPRRQSNPHNSNWVQINIDERDPNRANKMDAIKTRKLAFRHHIKSDGSIPADLLEAMRICLLDSTDLYFLDTPTLPTLPTNTEEGHILTKSVSVPKSAPISFEREILLYDTLSSLLQNRLEKMDETEAVDDREAFLAAVRSESGLSWPKMIGWQYRVEQKETLEAALDEVSVLKANFISSSRSNVVLESDIVPLVQDDVTQLSEVWQARIASWQLVTSAERPSKLEDGKVPVLRVPVEWVICSATIRTSTLGVMLSKAGVLDELEEEVLIAIFILFQLHTPGQPFNDYFQAVAKACKGRPKYMNALSFVDVSETLLQGTPAETEVSGQLEEYEQLFRRVFCKVVRPLHANFQDANMFAWKHFTWAFSIIACEGQLIPIPINGETEEMQLGIIPSFGTRRWHPQEMCELEYDDQGAIVISTSKTYPITGSPNAKHGFYSGCVLPRNEELIRSYGFFVKNHNMNIIPFPLFATEDDALLDKKMGILSFLRLDTDHFLDAIHVPIRIINTLKILSMDASELDALQQSIDANPSAVEINVSSKTHLRSFVERLKAMMDVLQTSVEDLKREQSTSEDVWIKDRFAWVMEYKNSLLQDIGRHQAYIEHLSSL